MRRHRREKMATGKIAATKVSFSSALKGTFIATVLAVAGNMLVYLLAHTLIEFPPEFRPLASVMSPVAFTLIAVILAGLIFLIVCRRNRFPLRTWPYIAWPAFILSFLPDVGMLLNPEALPFGGITPGGAAVLMAMHLVAFVSVMYAFPRFGVEQQT